LHTEQAGALANFTEAEELDPGSERVADSAPRNDPFTRSRREGDNIVLTHQGARFVRLRDNVAPCRSIMTNRAISKAPFFSARSLARLRRCVTGTPVKLLCFDVPSSGNATASFDFATMLLPTLAFMQRQLAPAGTPKLLSVEESRAFGLLGSLFELCFPTVTRSLPDNPELERNRL
jgi:hypothetical protein